MDSKKQRDNLIKAKIENEGCITNVLEGLLISNGDLAALVTIYQHEVCFNITKSDIWDARYDNTLEDTILKHDDLIKYESEYGFCWPTPVENDSPKPTWDTKPEGLDVIYTPATFQNWMSSPNPKPAGKVRIKHGGISSTKVKSSLDIEKGLLEITYTFPQGILIIKAFVNKEKNLINFRVERKGTPPQFEIIHEKMPDSIDKTIPMPEVWAQEKRYSYITQTIPEGFGVEEFKWCVAMNFPPITKIDYTRGSYRCYQKNKIDVLNYKVIRTVTFDEEETIDFTLSVATSREENKDSIKAAHQLADMDNTRGYDENFSKHILAWQEVWDKSSIWVEDEELTIAWHRAMYAFECHIKDNGMFPGMVANIPTDDYSAFHGSIIWNMNVQKYTNSALKINRSHWITAYAKAIKNMLPVFEHMSKVYFGLDGAYVDFITLPFVPKERAHCNNKWGRSLSTVGWVAQPLWYYWEYNKDKTWLKEYGYEFIKKAAIFYANYLDKYQKEDGADIYPSMHIWEGPGWMKEFRGNRNLIEDLVMFESTIKWAIKCAEVLEIDEDLRTKWSYALTKIPPIKSYWDGEKGAIAHGYSTELDYEDYGNYFLGDYYGDNRVKEKDMSFPYEAAAQWLIYPLEYISGEGDSELDKIARYKINTMVDKIGNNNLLGDYWNHRGFSFLALMRIQGDRWYDTILEAVNENMMDSGSYWQHINASPMSGSTGFLGRIPEAYTFPIEMVTEILFQTQCGVIRLFPALPKGKKASFAKLCGVGGFEVTASNNGNEINAKILSKCGKICKVKVSTFDVIESPSNAVINNGIMEFTTEKDKEYKVIVKIK